MPIVPEKTSIYKKVPVHQQKNTLGFVPELIQFNLKRRKFFTYKFGDKKNYLNERDIFDVKNQKVTSLLDKLNNYVSIKRLLENYL
jgi:hypothetical protein